MFRVFARAKSKPESVGAVRKLLQKLVKASRAEPGVLTYELFETQEGGEFLFFEVYADAAAFEAHKSSRHMASYGGRAMPLLQEELQLWVVDPVEPGAD